MTIAFIGNHSAEHSTENHHRKTFEKLGHTVIQLQENKTTVDEVMKHAVNADMLYFTHTHGWKFGTDAEVVEMFQTLRRLNIPTVGYHLDLWLGLEREKDLKNDPYWNIEHFFTVDKAMADHLNEHTETKGYFLPAGCFEDDCYIAEPNYQKYPHEIIFTGAKLYHHEWPYRQKLIEWLHKTYGSRFAHYGNGGLPVIRGSELNVLYSSAKIIVGDTLCKDFSYEYYFSDRLFEVPGRGGFMIFPNIRGIEFMYEVGKEIITYTFEDFEWLQNKINHFLRTDNPRREEIRLAGHNRVKSAHTYTHRLKQLLQTLEKEKATI